MREIDDWLNAEPAELEQHLAGLRADLEEVEEERMYVLSQTGLHVSAGAVRKYETEIDSLKERITEVEQLVRAKQGAP